LYVVRIKFYILLKFNLLPKLLPLLERIEMRRGLMLSTTKHGVVSSNMHTCPQPGDKELSFKVLLNMCCFILNHCYILCSNNKTIVNQHVLCLAGLEPLTGHKLWLMVHRLQAEINQMWSLWGKFCIWLQFELLQKLWLALKLHTLITK
jgi:hypothetical protein